MDEKYYNPIVKRVGSTSIKNIELSVKTLIELGTLTEYNSVADLLNLCETYQNVELDKYLNAKLEQNYGGQNVQE